MALSLAMEWSANVWKAADLSPNNHGFAMADWPGRLDVRVNAHDPEKHVLDLIGDGYRFSEKIMRRQGSTRLRPWQAGN